MPDPAMLVPPRVSPREAPNKIVNQTRSVSFLQLQACTTDGKQTEEGPEFPDRKCGGEKAMFKWDNSPERGVWQMSLSDHTQADWCLATHSRAV
jgi:hypothetical protein